MNPKERILHRIIFVTTLVLTTLFLSYYFQIETPVDEGLWNGQSQYVQTGNPEEFNFKGAYAYPGGPVVEGDIAAHEITGQPYDEAGILFLSMFSGLLVAIICSYTYFLKRSLFWTATVFGVLFLNHLLAQESPPSLIAGYLGVILSLITLEIFSVQRVSWKLLGWWGVAAGALAAARIDIGMVATAILGLAVLWKVGWKRCWLVIVSGLASFCAFDPFTWFMPFIKHISDLIYKMTIHYDGILVSGGIGWLTILKLSGFALVAMILALLFIVLKKKVHISIPRSYLIALLVLSSVWYAIILSSKFQAERYFFPITIIWEVLLPLLVFELASQLQFSFLKENQQKFGQFIFKLLFALALLENTLQALLSLVM